MTPWSIVLRSGYSVIWSLSRLSPSQPVSIAPAVLLSIGWSGKRGATVSGLSFHHTTSTGHLLGVWSIPGILLSVHTWALVFRTWLPMTSHLSLGWVSCVRPCLSVSHCRACCTWRPPTVPSPFIVTQISVWLCTRPRCIVACVLCIVGLGKCNSEFPQLCVKLLHSSCPKVAPVDYWTVSV